MKSTVKNPEGSTHYFVPQWMEELLEGLVTAKLARVLTNAKPHDGGRPGYSFEVKDSRKSTWWEHSLDEKCIIPSGDYGSDKYEEIKSFTSDFLSARGHDDWRMLQHLAESYAQDRDGREALPIHSTIVQMLLSLVVERYLVKNPGQELLIVGDYLLVGRFPVGAKIELLGDVEMIVGSIGASLNIQGDVKCLGLKGDEPGKLKIGGHLDGYKSSIENPKLDIEISGSVTTKGLFLNGSKFSTMIIHQDVSANSPFPGLFLGTVEVLGTIWDMEWATPKRWSNTSAYSYGQGNVRYHDRWIVRHGQLTTE